MVPSECFRFKGKVIGLKMFSFVFLSILGLLLFSLLDWSKQLCSELEEVKLLSFSGGMVRAVSVFSSEQNGFVSVTTNRTYLKSMVQGVRLKLNANW